MRNYTLDLFKFIACFLVIYIHSFVRDGETFLLYARIAVPMFFMITGFYYPVIIEGNKEKTYVKKILRLTLYSTLIYGLISYFYFHTFQINTEQLIKWIGLNLIPFTGGHLWYLYALIYVLIIVKVFRKLLFGKLSVYIILVLIGINYSLSFNDDSIFYRNFLFTGLPYFLSGFIVNRYKEKIKQIQISKFCFLLLILIFCVLLYIEYSLYETYNCFPIRDHYLMLYPLSVFTFCYAIRFPDLTCGIMFSTIGRKYSTDIYIYHLLFILFGDELMCILKSHGYISTVSHGFVYPFLIMMIVLFSVTIFRKMTLNMRLTYYLLLLLSNLKSKK